MCRALFSLRCLGLAVDDCCFGLVIGLVACVCYVVALGGSLRWFVIFVLGDLSVWFLFVDCGFCFLLMCSLFVVFICLVLLITCWCFFRFCVLVVLSL